MKTKRKLKKILIPVVSLVLAAAIGCGVWYYFGHRSSEPVNVYEFSHIGMTEYWGDSQESYGPVTTDKIQTVYLSDTQTVTEILVAPGDAVQKGDVLMTFDTTLSDLALERKRLDVEKLKLQLEDAKDQLAEINSMKPMVIPAFTEKPAEPDNVKLGIALTDPYQISTQSTYDGSTPELALICWLHSETAIEDAVFEALRLKAEEYQAKNAAANATTPTPSQTPGDTPTTSQPNTESSQPNASQPNASQPNAESSVAAPADQESSAIIEDSTIVEESSVPTDDSTSQPENSVPETSVPENSEPENSQPENSQPENSQPENSQPEISQPAPEPAVPTVDQFYAVFKVTEGNMSLGQATTWQGVLVNYDAAGQSYTFRFFDASGVVDHMLPASDEPVVEQPEIDFGSGYTSAQIAEMRSEQEKTIKNLEFSVKMAEADYKIMQTEVSDGNVYAEIDGTVVSLLTEEEAKMSYEPILKVSGGGGFYVEGTVSELEKDNLQIGQEVTINDWDTGMVYTGIVESVGDYPSSDNYYSGIGNPNASYYPFKVFVDESADLQSGRYVSVMYSTAVSENGIYLENPFLRTEQGRSYVYVQGDDGFLEKRYVVTGKSLWGSYTEILSGISAEDFIAFPYGKNLQEGAPTVESDLSTLYGW